MTLQVFQTNFPPSNTAVTDDKGNMTNAGTAFWLALWGRTGGLTGLQRLVTTGIATNTGSLGSTGTLLTTDWNLLQTGGGLTSNVALPALTTGQKILIQNQTGNNVTINPPAGATIDGGGNYTLPGSKMQIFRYFSATQIFSMQLG